MTRVVVVDTETSGLDPRTCGVVELAGVAYDYSPETRELVRVGHFQSLVDPGHEVPPEVSAVHHLTTDHVRGQPTLGEAVLAMVSELGMVRSRHDMYDGGVCPGREEDWPESDVLFAHNAKFDRGFLPSMRDLQWGCTLKAARALVEGAPSYSNQTLRYFLKTEPQIPEDAGLLAHRALYDCYVTGALLQHLLRLAPLGQLVEYMGKPSLLPKITFGKHRGKAWSDVDAGYLSWVLACDGDRAFEEDVRFTARHHLDRLRGR